jgi:sugar lactone lactonase YvrE
MIPTHLLPITVFLISLAFQFTTGLKFSMAAAGDDDRSGRFPQNATFTTLITTPRAIEGLTGDGVNNLYVGGSGPASCPIWEINLHNPSLTVVGIVPAAVTPAGTCGFSGIAFDAAGNLYQADGGAGRIYRVLKPNAAKPPEATIFAQGAPGTNGLAFDRHGNLWTGDGTTGRGRVWKITAPGADCSTREHCVEVFRIQPMANEVNLVNDVGGVGRDVRALPPGTITVTPTTRNAANLAGSQPLVANGIVFDQDGNTMFVIDTARGALWKVEFDAQGNLKSPIGCDSTFTGNTLCLSNVFVAHPILEGGDGIALDVAGNIWVDANERNAVAVVTKKGDVLEIFRNPVNLPDPVLFQAGLRNAGDQSVGNNHILEFPTSPFLTGKVLCTSQSDGERRDNSPRAAGEVNAGLPFNGTNQLGKISCMDQELKIPGLRLPITPSNGRR